MAKRTTTANILLSSLILAGASLFTSCEDYDNGFDEAMIRYNQNFIERYGKIDPNHNWGFGEIGSVDDKGGGKTTRANIGSDVNANQLLEADDNFTRIIQKYRDNSDIDINVTIPGYPGADGWYHVRFDDRSAVKHFKSEKEILNYMKTNGLGKGTVRPAGDVTNEEILYVSRWFREHKNPGTITVDWKNYFFQSISMDYDRYETEPGKCHGARILEREIQELQNEEWVTKKEYDLNYSTEYLQAKAENGVDFEHDNPGNNLQGWDEINNFNQGEYITNFGIKDDKVPDNEPDKNPDIQQKELHRFIMLFLGSGTQDFAWRGGMDSRWYNNWVLVHLDFTIVQTYDSPDAQCELHPGNRCISHHYNGLYLAFDWEMHKVGSENVKSDYECDGYYSNWILKLSSADPETETIPDGQPDYTKYRRIMCEDLGNTNDFDFNDLVFDVYYTGTEETKYTAHITVQAVGGTLPIYIGDPNNGGIEAHGILGGKQENGTYTPIINKENHIDAEEITITDLPNTNPDNVNIYVVNEGDKEAVREITLPTNEGGQYENPGSNVPQKICVPYGTPWTNEHQQIETLYPTFRNWVEDHHKEFWLDDYIEDDDESYDDDTTPELTITYNGATIGTDASPIQISSGEEIKIKCTSTNKNTIEIRIQQGTPSAIECEWNSSTHTLKVRGLDLTTNQQATIFFKQTSASGTVVERQISIEVLAGGTSSDTGFKWQDGSQGKKDITIIQGNSQTVYFTGNGNVTASGYDEDLIDVTVNSGNIYIEAKEDNKGSTTITLTQEGADNELELGVNVIEGGGLVDRPKDNTQWGTALDYFDGTQQWGLSNEPQTLNMKPNNVASIRIQDITNETTDYIPIVEGDTDCVKVDYDNNNNNKNCKITAIKKGTAKLVIPFPIVSGYNGEQYNETSITITINVSE